MRHKFDGMAVEILDDRSASPFGVSRFRHDFCIDLSESVDDVVDIVDMEPNSSAGCRFAGVSLWVDFKHETAILGRIVFRPITVRMPIKQHAHLAVKRHRSIDVRRSNYKQIGNGRCRVHSLVK